MGPRKTLGPIPVKIVMKRRTIGIVPIITVGIVLFGVVRYYSLGVNKEPKLKSEIIQVPDGYGYQVLNDDKLLIRQEFIPALTGRTAFQSPKDAKNVANLVVAKIQKGTSPRIDFQDLVNLGIVIKTPKL